LEKVKKKLTSLLEVLDYEKVYGEVNLIVTGISHDSRDVENGDLFFALEGENFDGHGYAKNAAKAGAVAVVGEKVYDSVNLSSAPYVKVNDSRKALSRISREFYDKPTSDLFTVGVTGTNGKTTTTHLVKEALDSRVTETISTITNREVPGRPEPVTTPEAPQIHEAADRARSKDKDNFVLEVSSHGLAMGRVSKVDFDVGIFTNITRDHLDYHDSMEEYKSKKSLLFSYLSPDDTAVLNGDQEFSEELESTTEARTVRYGLESSSDVVAVNLRMNTLGISFEVRSPWGKTEVDLNLFGKYNVYNSLAAITVGLIKGLELSDISEKLAEVGPLPGRMQKLELSNGADIYVDFAHNSGALEKALSGLKQLYYTVSVVFGCGGESDRGKRPEMGRVAGKYADKVYITDDNPKKENREEILGEIAGGIENSSLYSIIPNRKKAIEKAVEQLNSGETLLVAGKGHERYQVVGEEWIEYNDMEYLEKLCRGKGLI
jgi:UDP-N-acetylmuramoyl-L-alanyl-D-glutamate--2,6-diaminopimelate ligase